LSCDPAGCSGGDRQVAAAIAQEAAVVIVKRDVDNLQVSSHQPKLHHIYFQFLCPVVFTSTDIGPFPSVVLLVSL